MQLLEDAKLHDVSPGRIVCFAQVGPGKAAFQRSQFRVAKQLALKTFFFL